MAFIDETTRARLSEQLIRHEGLRLQAYQDTVGVWTIGVGHTSAYVNEGWIISESTARHYLAQDLEVAEADAAEYARHVRRHLSHVRRAVLVNMAFNLGGPRLRSFIGLERALRFERFRKAACEMIDSLWARQVKWRAFELAGQMMLGRWPPNS